MESVIVCRRCHKGFPVPLGFERRRFCPECRAIVRREAGLRTGGIRKAKPCQPAPPPEVPVLA